MDGLQLKALLFGNSGGDGKVVAAAEVMFEKFIAGDERVLNPNIRAAVFEIVLKQGGRKEVRLLPPLPHLPLPKHLA
jgi:aminopeptidase 2